MAVPRLIYGAFIKLNVTFSIINRSVMEQLKIFLSC